jgi:hypothetical protein
MPEKCRRACGDFPKYLESILEPYLKDLESDTAARTFSLHQVIGANLCTAHAIDYIQAIRTAVGIKDSRTKLIKSFDTSSKFFGARIEEGRCLCLSKISKPTGHNVSAP